MKSVIHKTFGAAAFALMLSSCASVMNGPGDTIDYRERHPIAVDSQTITMNISPAGEKGGLTAVDKARIRAFADAYFTRGHGPVTVTAPASGPGYKAAEQTAADARIALNAAGVSWDQIAGASYAASTAGEQVVTLSFTHYVATPSACGDWSQSVWRDQKNLPHTNFGCATMNNFAAMLADPHDLIAPAEMSPADAIARTRAINAYRAGDDPTSKKNADIEVDTRSN